MAAREGFEVEADALAAARVAQRESLLAHEFGRERQRALNALRQVAPLALLRTRIRLHPQRARHQLVHLQRKGPCERHVSLRLRPKTPTKKEEGKEEKKN